MLFAKFHDHRPIIVIKEMFEGFYHNMDMVAIFGM